MVSVSGVYHASPAFLCGDILLASLGSLPVVGVGMQAIDLCLEHFSAAVIQSRKL